MRWEEPNYVCFDDFLKMSACHMCCIPTHTYIPHWLHLLRDPWRGLEIVHRLWQICLYVLRSQFLTHADWKQLFLRELGHVDVDDLVRMPGAIATGFNYPPSQYQLHLQFIVLPLLPKDYAMYLRGNHFTPKRFFPLEYVLRVLERCVETGEMYTGHVDDIDAVIAFANNTLGVDYNAIHQREYNAHGTYQEALAPYNRSHFINKSDEQGNVSDKGENRVLNKEPADVLNADVAVLSSYDTTNQSFYSFAKREPLPHFPSV